MRWIVLALLLANIGLYAWFSWFESAADADEQPAETNWETPVEQGGGIRLLRELPQEQIHARAKAVSPAPRAPQQVPPGDICTLVGPFAEEFQGLDIVERLAALQVDASLREIETQGQMRYWVFMPPLGSKREAFNKLRELQAAGVDSYVIPKGSLTNGISFGIFSERKRAEALMEKLRQRGIDAHSREEPETYLERWVVLPPGAAEGLAEDFWTQLQSEYPELERRQNLCSEVKAKT